MHFKFYLTVNSIKHKSDNTAYEIKDDGSAFVFQ